MRAWSATSSPRRTWSACRAISAWATCATRPSAPGGGEDAQPFTVNYPFGIVMAHNGNVANYEDLRGELATDGLRHLYSGCDVEVAAQRLRQRAGRVRHASGFTLEAYHAAVREVYRRVRGAYSVVGYVAGHGMFAFRDPYGIKPIAIGRRVGNGQIAHAVASESVVLTTIGYETAADRQSPGEALFIDLDGDIHARADRRVEASPVRLRVRLLRPSRHLPRGGLGLPGRGCEWGGVWPGPSASSASRPTS